jgi:ketosteroid isomerase-like protein
MPSNNTNTVSRNAHSPVHFLTALLLLVPVAAAFGCEREAKADRRAADVSTLTNLDTEWSRTAISQDVDKTISYYAEDAIVLPPNGPVATSRDAIRNVWKEMITVPGLSGGWTATKVEVARSGEIGYVTGHWEFKWTDPSGKPASDRGKFLELWKKQADGTWKAAVDTWNSDLPLPS